MIGNWKKKKYMTIIIFNNMEPFQANFSLIILNTKVHFLILNMSMVINCFYYNAMHDFLVWLRTGSNPLEINRFGSYTGKLYIIS